MPTTVTELPASPAPAPKYLTLARQLKHQIDSGRLKPGDRLPSFSEMRTQFGATTATVERVFAALERDGLIQREQGRGTFVSEAKAVQPASRPNVIGFAGAATGPGEAPYWSHLIGGLQQAAQARGVQILLLGEVASVEAAAGMQSLGGLIWCEGRAVLLSQLAAALSPGVPCVSLLFSSPGIASVVSDDYGGAVLATEHLLSLGHRRIACVTAGDDTVSRARRAGYRAALRAAGIAPDTAWVRPMMDPFFHGSTFVGTGAATMREWMDDGWDETGCTAILAQNDETGIGVMKSLREAGLKVPRDVSVVGFDGTETGTFCTPALTSVAVPLEQLAAASLDLLLESDAGTLAPGAMILPSRLLVRGSTGPVRDGG